MATKLFDDKNLTEGEKEFISNILKDDKTLEVGSLYMQRAQTLATLRLAKEIEESTLSNNRSSRAMNWLTGALVFIGVCQVIVTVLSMWFK